MPEDRGLGAGVGRDLDRAGELRGARGQVDDRTAAPHLPARALDEEERALHVDRVEVAPLVERDVPDRLDEEDPRRVHEVVERTGRLGDAVAAGRIRHARHERLRARGRERRHPRLVDVDREDRRALLQQPLDDREPDPARGPGHDRTPTFCSTHDVLPPLPSASGRRYPAGNGPTVGRCCPGRPDGTPQRRSNTRG